MYSFKEEKRIYNRLFDFVKASAGLHLRHSEMNGLPEVMEEITQAGYESLMDKFRKAGIRVEARFDKFELARNDAGAGRVTFLEVDESALRLKTPVELPPVSP